MLLAQVIRCNLDLVHHSSIGLFYILYLYFSFSFILFSIFDFCLEFFGGMLSILSRNSNLYSMSVKFAFFCCCVFVGTFQRFLELMDRLLIFEIFV